MKTRGERRVPRRSNSVDEGTRSCWGTWYHVMVEAMMAEKPGEASIRRELARKMVVSQSLLGDRQLLSILVGLAQTIPLSTREVQFLTEGSAPYRIVAVNELWLKLCSYERNEVLGGTCKILQGRKTEWVPIMTMMRALQRNRAAEVSLVNYCSDGSPFECSLKVEPYRADCAHDCGNMFLATMTNIRPLTFKIIES